MHELRIAEDLSAIVTACADTNKLRKVTRVRVCFGQLIQIIPDIFRTAFTESVKNTLAEEASLEIEIIPVSGRCSSCSKEFKVEDIDFRCVNCGGIDIELVTGKELFVESIEGE
jgi:hydrogenase nickel incorporation protein HypA/HybF